MQTELSRRTKKFNFFGKIYNYFTAYYAVIAYSGTLMVVMVG
jgi:hypothetical protein